MPSPSAPPAPRRHSPAIPLRPLAALLLATVCAWAQDALPTVLRTCDVPGRRISLMTGQVKLPCDAATITVPAGMVFVPYGDARHVIEVLWRNPISTGIMGMLVPEDADFIRDPAAPPQRLEKDLNADAEAVPKLPQEVPAEDPEPASPRNEWALVINWTEGHMRESQVPRSDFDAVLASMQGSMPRVNAERHSRGGGLVPDIELLGWASPPRYDAARHTLVLSRRIAFYLGSSQGAAQRIDMGTQINHSAFVLGARGVLEFNAIASEDALQDLLRASDAVLGSTQMLPGHRYGDFRPGEDPEYTGDLAARLYGGDDPGRLDLAIRTRVWLWTIVCMVLAALVVAVVLVMTNGRRNQQQPAVPLSPSDATAGSTPCPRCAQPMHPNAARCPACGASAVNRGDPRS